MKPPRTLGDVLLRRRAEPVAATSPLMPAISGLRSARGDTPQQQRIAASRDSIETFCRTYLRHHFSRKFCELHEDIFKICDETTPGKRKARIAPRKFGKTTIISLAKPLQELAYKRKEFILMIGEASAVAESNLATIIQELDTNELLLQDFPHLAPAKDPKGQMVKWTDRQLVFASGATVVAKGMGSRMRGLKHRHARPDMAILDDPESPETADTFLKRRRHKRWFGGTFLGLGASDWDVYVIGNLPNHDCLIADLVKDPAWDGRLWRAINIPTRRDERYPLGNTRTDGSALWPEEWSLAKLDAYRKEPEVGSLGFAREMMNDPREEEDKSFDPGTFTYVEWSPDLLATYGAIRTYIDPAGGEKPGELKRGKRDWCVIVTAGRTRKEGFIDIFDVRMNRFLPNKQIQVMLDAYAAYGAQEIGVEENMFKNLIAPTIQQLARKRGLYPKITPNVNTSNKISRILGMQPLIENGVVRFARHLVDKVPEYFGQFDEFPADFDDGPDATEGVVRMLESGRKTFGKLSGPVAPRSYWKGVA
jgi:predicted phage terminase large subunit-like protein